MIGKSFLLTITLCDKSLAARRLEVIGQGTTRDFNPIERAMRNALSFAYYEECRPIRNLLSLPIGISLNNRRIIWF